MRKRLGFPKIGSFDTWRIDKYIRLCEHNHGVIKYPGWVSASDYLPTPEKFDFVPLHSEELGAKIVQKHAVLADSGMAVKLTPTAKFIAECYGLPLPLTPVTEKEEKRLFARLVLAAPLPIDFDAMALLWVDYVDGDTILPKLPVYLSQYYAKWQHNRRVADHVRASSHLRLAPPTSHPAPPLSTGKQSGSGSFRSAQQTRRRRRSLSRRTRARRRRR